MKRILILFSIVVVSASCRSKYGGDFKVSGKIDHATGTKVYLTELPFDITGKKQPILLDSTTLKNGSFELNGVASSEGLYRIHVDNDYSHAFILINDSKDIKLTADINHYKDYKIEGSQASTALHQFYDGIEKEFTKLWALSGQMDSLQKNNASDSLLTITNLQAKAQLSGLQEKVKHYLSSSSSPTVSLTIIAIGYTERIIEPIETRKLVDDAVKKFKGYEGLGQFQDYLVAKEKQQAEDAKPKPYVLLNQQAPEIALPSLNGDTVRLSSYKGKYVLVDFWASWCGPCRNENPNVVAAYSKYKNKNFDILGVSLDDNKQAWANAVKQDSLTWTHVSDLKRWSSPLPTLFHFDHIPYNVLIDPSGKIIATELKGEELEKKLAEVLK